MEDPQGHLFDVPSAVDGQGRTGDIGIVEQVTQALVDHFTARFDAQCGFGQCLGAIGCIVVGIEQ
ncbi:hypothetical protein D3C75_1294680 [compost metagenome]